MKDWKTTIPGLVAALCGWAKNVWPEGSGVLDAIAALAIAVLGWNAAQTKK